MEKNERMSSIGPAGVLATACMQKGIRRNTGSPSGDSNADQLAARERQAGPYGVAERPAVPARSGNSDGGKGPQLKGNAKSDKGLRD